MLEAIADLIRKEIEKSVAPTVRHVQNRILSFVIRTILISMSLIALILGIILLGSKFIGLDFMLLISGSVLFLLFLFVK